MSIKDEFERLIRYPKEPNPVEWAMDAEDALVEVNALSAEAKGYINNIKAHNGAFQQDINGLVAILKRVVKNVIPQIKAPEIKTRHQVFVAMMFDDERQRLYKDVLKPVVNGLNFAITKVDDEEYEGSIIGRIVDDISDSIILISDLTGNRGGVYYETGIAKGLQLCNHPIRIILTCNKEFFDKDKVHFDVQSENIILYSSDEEYRQRLTSRIQAIIQGEA